MSLRVVEIEGDKGAFGDVEFCFQGLRHQSGEMVSLLGY